MIKLDKTRSKVKPRKMRRRQPKLQLLPRKLKSLPKWNKKPRKRLKSQQIKQLTQLLQQLQQLPKLNKSNSKMKQWIYLKKILDLSPCTRKSSKRSSRRLKSRRRRRRGKTTSCMPLCILNLIFKSQMTISSTLR